MEPKRLEGLYEGRDFLEECSKRRHFNFQNAENIKWHILLVYFMHFALDTEGSRQEGKKVNHVLPSVPRSWQYTSRFFVKLFHIILQRLCEIPAKRKNSYLDALLTSRVECNYPIRFRILCTRLYTPPFENKKRLD